MTNERGSSSSSKSFSLTLLPTATGGNWQQAALSWRSGWTCGRLTINFVDDGPPFDPLAHSEPDFEASSEQRPVGGLGIAIVRALAHRASYRREGHRNHLYLIRRLAPATQNVTPPR